MVRSAMASLGSLSSGSAWWGRVRILWHGLDYGVSFGQAGFGMSWHGTDYKARLGKKRYGSARIMSLDLECWGEVR